MPGCFLLYATPRRQGLEPMQEEPRMRKRTPLIKEILKCRGNLPNMLSHPQRGNLLRRASLQRRGSLAKKETLAAKGRNQVEG
jgi:hypothetical protein